ncbi:MAG: hypothetical protein MUE50_27535, partial [Pirellulaceae bacterium]|nr:hypothetical protein [Pirellulaceae bacterium]
REANARGERDSAFLMDNTKWYELQLRKQHPGVNDKYPDPIKIVAVNSVRVDRCCKPVEPRRQAAGCETDRRAMTHRPDFRRWLGILPFVFADPFRPV